MRFKKLFVASALTSLVAATPVPTDEPSGSCNNNGSPKCCEQLTSIADNPDLHGLLDLLGIVIHDVTALIGLGCSPLVVVGGGTCASQTVCCDTTVLGGLISIGCVVVLL